VMVSGATGFIGQALVTSMLKLGHDVSALNRSKADNLPRGVKQVVIGDLSNLKSSQIVDDLRGIDVVVHTAARVHVMNDTSADPLAEFRKVNLDGTMALARQAAEAGVKRFVFLSSIKVNGESTRPGKPFAAEDEPAPEDPYGVSKAEAEAALLTLADATGMEVVIIRPVLVYGPGVRANFNSLMRWLSYRVPLPLGMIQNKRSMVALDNLVDLIITCLDNPAAVNQVFLVSDGEDLSTTELLSRVGVSLGKPAILLPVPAWLIRSSAGLLGKSAMAERLTGSLQVDITKTRDLLGWIPPVTVDDALLETTRSFLSNE